MIIMIIKLLFLKDCAYWSEWEEFSFCSASCGGGLQTRERICINGEPGDAGCLGAPEEKVSCNMMVNNFCLFFTLKL